MFVGLFAPFDAKPLKRLQSGARSIYFSIFVTKRRILRLIGEMTHEEEERLIRKVKSGNVAAYAPLVEHYGRAIFALVLRIVGRREEAEEVAQDVFLKAFRSLDRFDGRSRFSTYLYRIACNTALSAVRSRKQHAALFDERRVERISDPAADEETIELDALSEAQSEALWRALDRLAPEERALVQLHYYENLPLAECGEALHLTENNAKVRLHRIRKKLAVWILEES